MKLKLDMLPHADAKFALGELLHIANSLEMKHPEALFITSKDFNRVNLKSELPKYYQHISFPTRGPNTLDHSYSTIIDVFHQRHPQVGLDESLHSYLRALTCSDHLAVFVLLFTSRN